MLDTCLVHVEDGHPKIMSISIGSVGAKNTMQSLLRDIGQCCKSKEVSSIKSSKPVAKATNNKCHGFSGNCACHFPPARQWSRDRFFPEHAHLPP